MIRATRNVGWITERTGVRFTDGARGIEYHAGNRTLAMVGFDEWALNSVTVHMAADSAMAVRALIRPAFAYAFWECHKGVLIGKIADNNYRSKRLTEWLGFTKAYAIKDGWDRHVDFLIYEMRRENCRWLGGEEMAA